jgi:5-methylthioadenosine/S-adenosylhomocysteine deaminase
MPTTPTPCDLLLTAALIVSQNESREVLREAGLAITDGRIAALGTARDLARRFAPRETIDLPRAMVLPGLINTHTHAAMTLFRGLCDDAPLDVWLTRHIWPAESRLTAEAVRLGTALACAEMLSTGTTCFFDSYLFAESVAEAADASGLRAVIGQGVMEIDNPAFKTPEASLDAAAALAERLAGHDRLRLAIFAHAVYSCSTRTLARCVAFTRDRGLLLSTHAVETARENDDCQKAHGCRVIPYLRGLDFLGPKTLLAHGVALDQDDIATLAATGTAVAHCPKSNLKLGSGIAPVAALRAAGVRLGLGTDGAASNNALNLFSETQVAALLQKVATGDPTALDAQAALDMATRDGADALGWPGLGRLAPGSPADLCALDLTRPCLSPGLSPVSDAVYAASGGEVILTMVAGKVLYRDGAFPGLDYPGLLAAFKEGAAGLIGPPLDKPISLHNKG